MNKEPKEVDWSKQKPGTIGVTRDGKQSEEFVQSRGEEAIFWSSPDGYKQRFKNGRVFSAPTSDGLDILLPWESCIAEGHNPEGLTNAQVGEEWRLAKLDETIKSPIQWWDDNKWREIDDSINFKLYDQAVGTYRVPITKAKKRIPCGPEHFPPGTVVHAGDPLHHSPVGVCKQGIRCWDTTNEYEWHTFLQQGYAKWRRSTDGGKTWLPCYIETEE